ncbi:hypothetical protein GCM10009836_47640 [Pseudonocardia ailaonensis]|uniref:GPP34 family phosphoprotein n=1 Tax=Pseudonocardia ailaonensis TaxID=367279 RepID=A0ABN2NCF2_9PSEU
MPDAASLTLPERLYLLTYDAERNRFGASGERGALVRAAALTQLLAAGALKDEDGRVVAVPRARVTDPFLAQVLAEVAEHTGRPRRWQTWVGRRAGKANRQVRDALAGARWIRVEERTLLPARVTPRDPRAVRKLVDATRAVLRAPRLDTADRTDADALGLAAAARLRTVVSRAEAKQHKERLDAVTGPPAKGLRKAIDAQHAAAASG